LADKKETYYQCKNHREKMNKKLNGFNNGRDTTDGTGGKEPFYNINQMTDKLLWKEKDLKQGDWIYTPDAVFGSGGKEHNIFQYDERINYSLDFSREIRFYKLQIPQADVIKSVCIIHKNIELNRLGECYRCLKELQDGKQTAL